MSGKRRASSTPRRAAVLLPCHASAKPMRYWDAAFAFLAAMAVAAALTPLTARLAWRVGAVVMPSERGLAERPTPALGGLAILAGVLVAAAFWLPATINLH